MGGSGRRDPELLEIPGTEGVDGGNNIAVQSMMDLMNKQLDPQQVSQNVPLQKIAGLTGNEQTVQGLLSQFLGGSATDNEGYKAGMGEIQKTLGGDYNPEDSTFWKGYRDYSASQEEKGVSDVRRRGQLGGGLYATPNQRTENDYRLGSQSQRNMQLGSLYNTERDRQSNAVNQALGYAGFEETGKTNRLQLGSTIGAIPRNVQNQKNTAGYNQEMGQMTAKNKQEQANYANQLAEVGIQSSATQNLMPQWSVDNTQQSSPLGGILGLVGTLATAGK